MKLYNKLAIFVSGCLIFSACSDLDTYPEGGVFTSDQKKETVEALPDRLAADINGMFASPAKQYGTFPTSNPLRADDFGYPAICLSQDFNGPDMVGLNSDYNWFSTASEYSDRSDTYANPYMRYAVFYAQIKLANDVLASIPEDTENAKLLVYKAQAKAIRAFDYLGLVPYFQYKYKGNEEAPSVPIVTHDMTTDPSDNPRATQREVYELILADLTEAITLLNGYTRTSKGEIDQSVAYGLRARANLYMENWADAAADAEKAMQGYTLYSKADVSKPAFTSASESSWMWAFMITPVNIVGAYASWPSWISSFSGKGYAAGTGCYAMINSLLYDKIPSTDVRKGWWVNANLESPNLSTVTWNGVTGNAVAPLNIKDVKAPFLPYTNVKFGQYEFIGNTVNASDWCLMRAEEMVLIQAEATAMAGNLASGKTILESFVKTYRDDQYISTATSASEFQDEVWLQRRIELWGEGFSMADIMRLSKNIVRFTNSNPSNFPEAFRFNVASNDGWLLMRFPQKESNNNRAIVNNNDGAQPIAGAGANLRDGITD